LGTPKAPKPDLVRQPEGRYGWVDHRFKWFWEELSREELLLYYFLITTSNIEGCSWYSSRKICKVLKIGPATLIRARQTLEQRRLIATNKDELSQRTIYQVLPLPIDENARIQIPLKPTVEKNPAPKPVEQSMDSSNQQQQLNIRNIEKIQGLLKSLNIDNQSS
jgi:hypothetical protein